MTLKEESAKALRTLPFYVLTPTLLVGVVVNFLTLITGNFVHDFLIANSITLGALCFGLLLWLLRQVIRSLWFARDLTAR